jgi:hypothetical protein
LAGILSTFCLKVPVPIALISSVKALHPAILFDISTHSPAGQAYQKWREIHYYWRNNGARIEIPRQLLCYIGA